MKEDRQARKLSVTNRFGRRFGRYSSLLVAALLMMPQETWAQAEAVPATELKPAPELQPAEDAIAQADLPSPKGVQPGNVSVLVYMNPGANRAAVNIFANNQGGFVKYEYDTVLPDVINIRDIPPAAIDALRNMPDVARVEEDEYHENVIRLDEATPLVRGLSTQLTGAGFSADGTGIRVCICDTGIDSDHLMYADRIDTAAGYDFYNDDSNPEDDNGHGSHVAGIAVGGAGLSVDFGCDGSEPFEGVAHNATLIGVKILNSFGGGFDSDIIAGIDWCADPTMPNGPADVINLSIGTGNFAGTCDSHAWANAANNAVAAGVVVVAASGNECNTNSMGSPACGTDVIAVGATYKDDYPNCENGTSSFNWCGAPQTGISVDDLVDFSNQSDFLDVVAPGSVIWSASISPGGNSITPKSGTSMSSPMVAGLAALILSADSSLTPAQVRQIIRDGAIDMGTAGFDRGYGYGRIDVINSLNLVQPAVCPDGACNGGEDQCSCPQDCGSPPAAETSCADGLDEDCDGLTDCDDGDCTGDPACVCVVNGVCEAGEDCDNCPADCFSGTGASCGNGICEIADGEDCRSCPDDCNGKQNGRPSGRFCCGDGDGQNPADCNDAICTSDGFACTDVPAVGSCCGDTVCEGSEDGFNCEVDCGPPAFCGDTFCDPGEDQCSCATDCGVPPASEAVCDDGVDEDCDGSTDCNDSDCAADPACQDPCDNDGVCEPGEDCDNCSNDCDSKTNGNPNGRFCCGDGVHQPAEGDGTICDGNY